MNKPQPSKREQLRQLFLKILNDKREMEDKVLRLLKHPDSTGSQIMEARQALLAVEEPLGIAVRKLREKYPYQVISYAVTPWCRPEFDKYMEVKNGV